MRPVMMTVVMSAAIWTGGCGMSEGLLAMRDQADQVRREIEADRAALEASAGMLTPDHPARPRLEALAGERGEQAEAYARALARLDELIARGEADPASALESGSALLAPFLPPGARLPVLLAGGLGAAVWRASRLKKAGLSIAESLEKAMRDDGALREGVHRQAATLRAVQTPTARRLVDEATKDRPMLRLPL